MLTESTDGCSVTTSFMLEIGVGVNFTLEHYNPGLPPGGQNTK